MNRTAVAIAWVAVASGCAAIPRPLETDAARGAQRWPETTLATLEAGRTRYVARCSGCHALKTPAKYPEDRWTAYVDKMNDRAKLSGEDRESILRYLLVMRDRSPRPSQP